MLACAVLVSLDTTVVCTRHNSSLSAMEEKTNAGRKEGRKEGGGERERGAEKEKREREQIAMG
mgnify:CR=1 FL=1